MFSKYLFSESYRWSPRARGGVGVGVGGEGEKNLKSELGWISTFLGDVATCVSVRKILPALKLFSETDGKNGDTHNFINSEAESIRRNKMKIFYCDILCFQRPNIMTS